MARSKPWFKAWANWPSNPDLARLNLAQFGAWWKLYTLAHSCAAGGRIVTDTGRALTLEEIFKSLHISDAAEVRVFKNMIKRQLDTGSLKQEDDTLIITHYVEEQETTTTATSIKGTKEALRERVKRYRERHAADQNPLPLTTLPPEEDSSTLKEIPSDSINTTEEEGNGVTSVTQQPVLSSDVTDKPLHKVGTRSGQGRDKVGKTLGEADPIIAEITTLYEENIGPLPTAGLVIEDMLDFTERFKGELSWIRLAFKDACSRNKRTWQYIRKILERWQEEGGPDGRAGEELRQEKRTRSKTDKGDSLEASKRAGWNVKRSGPEQADIREENR